MALQIVQFNINGFMAHVRELKHFISVRDIDICLIQETFLKPKKQFSLPGYVVLRKDRLDPRGGLLILIKQGIRFSEIKINSDIEAQAIAIRTDVHDINLVNVYSSPNAVFDEKDYDNLFNLGSHTILCGDFNAHSHLWKCKNTDKRGEIMENFMDKYDYVLLNTGQSTLINSRGDETCVDLTFCSANMATKINWYVNNSHLGSDHNPIVIQLNQKVEQESDFVSRWKLQKSDWAKFNVLCHDKIDAKGFENLDTDDKINTFVDYITQAASAAIPKTRHTPKNKRFRPYWNEKIKIAVYNRNKAKNKYTRSKRVDDAVEYRKQKSLAQRTIKDESQKYWQDYCSSLTSHNKLGSIWRMAKRMNGVQDSPSSRSIKINGIDITRDDEKAEHFAQHFADVTSNKNHSPEFIKHKTDVETNYSFLFTNDAPTDYQNRHLNVDFTLYELEQAIRFLKNNSAPGEDTVAYEMIKHLPNVSLRVLLNIFNEIWSNGTLPRKWKHTIVLPFLKQGKDPNLVDSYRPISLTSSICKLMERLITSRLEWYLESNQQLSGFQSGFRKARSTIDHIIRLQDQINKSLHNKTHTMGLFLDFNKAFDLVWSNGLLIKLKNLGINGNMFNFIKDFLTDRKIQVRIGNKLSKEHNLENGTPQGSVISPILFLIMINDLPDQLQGVEVSLFADDTTIYKSSKNIKVLNKIMQNNLDAINKWSNEWGFKISTEKTVVVLFTNSTKLKNKVDLTLNGKNIKVENSVKFLGLIFDQRLTWSEHIRYIKTKIQRRINLLRAVSGSSWGASTHTLLILYRHLIRPLLDYGDIAIDSASVAQKKILATIQSRALKICTGTMTSTENAALQVELNESPLDLRRLQHQIEYSLKTKALHAHPGQNIFKDHWTNYYGSFNETNATIYSKVKEFYDLYPDIGHSQHERGNIPPWKYAEIRYDTELVKQVSKNEAPAMLLALTKQKVLEYEDTLQVFTDASKHDDLVGIGIHIKKFKENGEHQFSYRLTDNTSVFVGELTAIKIALVKLSHLRLHEKVTIFSDSLSAIQAISSKNNKSAQNLIIKIKETITKYVKTATLVWVPSHIGLDGNERADVLANIATTHSEVDIKNIPEWGEVKKLAKTYVADKWQQKWELSSSQFRKLKPKIEASDFKFRNRRNEVIGYRLRLSKCRLNFYMFQIGKHETGKCNLCKEYETIEHFLMQCKTQLVEDLKDLCTSFKIEYTLQGILNNACSLNFIADRCDRII